MWMTRHFLSLSKGLPLVKRLGMEMHVGSLTEKLNDETGMTEKIMKETC